MNHLTIHSRPGNLAVIAFTLVIVTGWLELPACLAQTQKPVGERTVADVSNAQQRTGEAEKQNSWQSGSRLRDEIFSVEIPWESLEEPTGRQQDEQSSTTESNEDEIDFDALMWQIDDLHKDLIANDDGISSHTRAMMSDDEAFATADGIGGTLAGNLAFHGDCTSFAYSPDSRFIYCGLFDGQIKIVETSTWKVREQFRLGADPIDALGVTPDGNRLIACSMKSKSVFVRSLANGQVAVHNLPRPFGIWHVRISPDARMLAVSGFSGYDSVYTHSSVDGEVYKDVERRDPNFYVYNTNSGAEMLTRKGTLEGSPNPWLPQGRLLLGDGKVWDIPGKKFAGTLPVNIPYQTGFTVADDGLIAVKVDSYAALEQEQVFVRLHSGSNGQKLGSAHVADLQPDQGLLWNVAISPDSNLLAVDVEAQPLHGLSDSTSEHAIRLISLENGKHYSLPNARVIVDLSSAEFDNSGTIVSGYGSGNPLLQFSPDQRFLTAMVYDKRGQSIVRTWQIELRDTPKKIQPPREPAPELSHSQASSALYEALCTFVKDAELVDGKHRRKSESELKAAMKPLYEELIDDVTRIFRGKSHDEVYEIHLTAMDMYRERHESSSTPESSFAYRITQAAPERDFSKWKYSQMIEKIMNER